MRDKRLALNMGTPIYTKYPHNIYFGGKKVLNIGCGFARLYDPNVVNLDAYENCNPDVIWDLNKTPLPFANETFDLILANHIMEHLPSWWECFDDLGRILKPNGQLEIWVPGGGTDSIRGYRDHINEINYCSFFGTHGTYRSGANAWAVAHTEGWANRLKLIERRTVYIKDRWMSWMPNLIIQWMGKHLRNIILEDGYIFRRVTDKEYAREQEMLNDRIRDLQRNTAIRVS